MKIAISNLAWEKPEDSKILPILQKYQIKGIEIATTKIWEDPTKTSDKLLNDYKKYWQNNGISIIATTSLLFGHPELTIFENQEIREKTLAYLSEMIRLSSALGAKAMVFGSPKNRKTFDKKPEEVKKIAQDFFYQIGQIAQKYDIYFGIEPNPPVYGTDFILSTKEAIELVKLVNHPHFRLHLDTSTMAINKESYEESIKNGLPVACHFHISEPLLKPIPYGEVDHQKVAKVLKGLDYDKWVSIEMPLGPEYNHPQQIEKTLEFVTKIYDQE